MALRLSALRPDDVIDLLVHLAASVAALTGTADDFPPLPLLGTGPVWRSRPLPPSSHDVVFDEPAPGWFRVEASRPDLPWSALSGNPHRLHRLHDWSPVGTLVPRDAAVCARVTAVTKPVGIDSATERALDDARLLLAAAARFTQATPKPERAQE